VRLYNFHQFVTFVKEKSRHALDQRNTAFLQDVLETSKTRLLDLAQGEILWRSQIAHEDGEHESGPHSRVLFQRPANVERMIPWRDRAKEGRANAKGIPVLYCATTYDTAIAEVRPWIGARITVAKLSLRRALCVVDCSPSLQRLTLSDIRTQEDAVRDLWTRINDAFSEPVTESDNTADYAPTQFLADAFRQHGYDGIKYRSRVGEGCNLGLFDLDAIEIVTRELYVVQGLTVKSQLMHWYQQYW
jgi:hypothetical protein